LICFSAVGTSRKSGIRGVNGLLVRSLCEQHDESKTCVGFRVTFVETYGLTRQRRGVPKCSEAMVRTQNNIKKNH